mgnify:CR=1 FL=1
MWGVRLIPTDVSNKKNYIIIYKEEVSYEFQESGSIKHLCSNGSRNVYVNSYGS